MALSDDDLLGVLSSQKRAAPKAAAVNDDALLGALPPKQMSGPLRGTAITGSGIVQGLAHIIGMPGDIAGAIQSHLPSSADQRAWLVRNGIMTPQVAQEAAAREAQNAKDNPSWAPAWNSNAADTFGTPAIDKIGAKLGLFNRPDLKPQNKVEQIATAGAQGLGGAAAFDSGLPSAFAGATSGVGSQVARDAFPKYPGISSFVGGLLGALVPSGVGGTVSKIANAVSGVGNDMVNAYRTAGITPRLAGDVTGNRTLQGLQAFATKDPIGAARMAHAAHDTLGEFQTATENVASGLGRSQTQQDVGNALQGQSRQWLANFRTGSQQRWNLLDQYLPGDTQIGVTNYHDALQRIARDLAGAPSTADILQPGMSRNLATALGNDTAGSAAATGSLTLPWNAVKGIRTRIGEMLSDPVLPVDSNEAELKRIYAGLSQDMQTAARRAGPQAQAAFDNASGYTRNGHDFIDTILRPIMREGQTPEGAAQSVLGKLNSGGSNIAQIRHQMPAAADEVAAYKVRDMAAANPGAQNATGNAVSPATFLTDWSKLSPEAKSSLFVNSDTQDQLSALARISDGIRQTMRQVNTSNTAQHSAWGNLFGTLKNVGYAAAAGYGAGHLAGAGAIPGAVGAGLLAGVEPMSGYVASRLTSSPALTSYFAAPSTFALDPQTARAIAGLSSYAALPPPQDQSSNTPQ